MEMKLQEMLESQMGQLLAQIDEEGVMEEPDNGIHQIDENPAEQELTDENLDITDDKK